MINPIERITQNRIIQLFQEQLGYTYYGNWEKREHNSNVEQEILKKNLLERGYIESLANKAVKEVYDAGNTNAGSLYERSKAMYSLLRYGVKARPELDENFETIFPIDWNNWHRNEFGISEEVTLAKGQNIRRPDIVLYVNGIALGVLELKRGTTDIAESVRQSISNQKEKFNDWFYSTVQFLFAGNNTQGLKYGTIETPDKYYLCWKEDEQENDDYKLDKYLKKLCVKDRFIDMIYNGVVFDAGVKKLPRPHQYFALKAAQPFIHRREGGILWHTQGSDYP